MNNVLVTGANGFVGRYIAADFRSKDFKFLSRSKSNKANWYKVSDFNEETTYDSFLTDISVVIHLAAVAHQYDVNESEFHKVNFTAATKLAMQAAVAGVTRFIYMSTVSVYGDLLHVDIDTKTKPIDFSSKIRERVEEELYQIGTKTGMEIVIIRSPLVYGKYVPGNFNTLLKLAESDFPLPLGAINNRRSFVAVNNLVDLIITCINHPDAANQTFLVSDDEDISTSTLLNKLIKAANRKTLLLPIPVSFLKFIAGFFGKKKIVERFSSSLTVDIEHTKKTLNWSPPITLDEGIRQCFN